jgi:hypothetical protein
MYVVTARAVTAIIVRTNRGCAMSSFFVVCTACGVSSDGSVRGLTVHGAEQIALCRLNRPRLLEARRMMIELFSMLEACVSGEAGEFLRFLQGFPDNLPRLSTLRPPDGNMRPESIVDSCYARHQRGELPATY